MAGKPEREQRDQLKGHRLQWSRWVTMGLRVRAMVKTERFKNVLGEVPRMRILDWI